MFETKLKLINKTKNSEMTYYLSGALVLTYYLSRYEGN